MNPQRNRQCNKKYSEVRFCSEIYFEIYNYFFIFGGREGTEREGISMDIGKEFLPGSVGEPWPRFPEKFCIPNPWNFLRLGWSVLG